jgi:hypothetical protein
MTPTQAWEYRPGIGMMAPNGTRHEDRATGVEYQWLAWSPAGDQFLLQRLAGQGEYLQPSAIFLAPSTGPR